MGRSAQEPHRSSRYGPVHYRRDAGSRALPGLSDRSGRLGWWGPRALAARHNLSAWHRCRPAGLTYRNSYRGYRTHTARHLARPDAGRPSTTSSTTGLAPVFDGSTGTVSGTCLSGANMALARPTASASSPTGMIAAAPVGRVGIPMGATELGAGGLSPPPVALTDSSSSLQSTSAH